MMWTASDFNPALTGPQFQWLNERLTLHGFPVTRYTLTLRDRVAAFQRHLGFTGSGADGYVGPKTLAALYADPQPHGDVPCDIINLARWKLTRPDAKEIMPSDLVRGYEDIDCFFANAEGNGVVFLVDINGKLVATTPNSTYPRSELREMNANGTKAGWTNMGERHVLRGRCLVTELPAGKPSLVFAQMHDADDDVVMLQVYGEEVYLSESLGKGQGSVKHPLLTNYRKNQPLEYEIAAFDELILATVNGKSITPIRKRVSGAYYKAGTYSQANRTNGSGHAETLHTDLELEAA